MPGASMLTKVIIMAASGKGVEGGVGGGREWGSSARVEGDSCGGAFDSPVSGARLKCAGGISDVHLGRSRPRAGGALVHVGDGGFVAVVAVGDDELFVGHGGDDEVDEVRVGEAPDAVDDVVLVGDFEVGGGAPVGVEDEVFGGEGGVGVEHVDLLAVGAGGFEEGEAVGLVLGEGLLVAVDDLVGVVVEVAEGDEAAAFPGMVVRCRGRCRSGSSRRGRARTPRGGCLFCARR